MHVTRREFLGYAAASVATGGLARWPLGRAPEPDDGAMVFREPCVIAESAAGYEAALRATDHARGRIVVVPAMVEMSKAGIRAVHDRLDAGATVILESGAVFSEERSSSFRNHRAMLRDEFDILVGGPISLWPARSVPYIAYDWPRPAMVRDYSRAISLQPRRERIVATLDQTPVGMVRAVGCGTLIVLGSPLGPALWFGDSAASAWLSDVVESSLK